VTPWYLDHRSYRKKSRKSVNSCAAETALRAACLFAGAQHARRADRRAGPVCPELLSLTNGSDVRGRARPCSPRIAAPAAWDPPDCTPYSVRAGRALRFAAHSSECDASSIHPLPRWCVRRLVERGVCRAQLSCVTRPDGSEFGAGRSLLRGLHLCGARGAYQKLRPAIEMHVPAG